MNCRILFLLGMLIVSFSALCHADDSYTFIVKKQEDKAKNRWSLADWLDTRDKMRMQDLWLALHSPSPYEFYLGGNYQFNQAPTGSFNAWEAYFAAYASIFGLEGRYESGLDKRWFGIFDFRVFGYHDQSTNITLQVGLRDNTNSAGHFRSILTGVSLTIYLAKFFGIEGLYRHYFSSTPTDSGGIDSGDRFLAGAFLDFKFVRIYGEYFWNVENLSDSSGIVVGTKLYF